MISSIDLTVNGPNGPIYQEFDRKECNRLFPGLWDALDKSYLDLHLRAVENTRLRNMFEKKDYEGDYFGYTSNYDEEEGEK